MALRSLVILVLFLSGCSDNSMSKVYDKRILDSKIECMRLLVFPPNEKIQNTLESLYDFDKKCELDLVVSYKDSITCNSNQNANKKAYGMPSSYLRLELKRSDKLYYSYYIDLDSNIESKNIKDGFDKMREELHFKKRDK